MIIKSIYEFRAKPAEATAMEEMITDTLLDTGGTLAAPP